MRLRGQRSMKLGLAGAETIRRKSPTSATGTSGRPHRTVLLPLPRLPALLRVALLWPLALAALWLWAAGSAVEAAASPVAALSAVATDPVAAGQGGRGITLRPLPQPASASATPRLRFPTATASRAPGGAGTPTAAAGGGVGSGSGTASAPGATGSAPPAIGEADRPARDARGGSAGGAAGSPSGSAGAAAPGMGAGPGGGTARSSGAEAAPGSTGEPGSASEAGAGAGRAEAEAAAAAARAGGAGAPAEAIAASRGDAGPRGLIGPPAEDAGIRRLWAAGGSPRAGQSWLARLTADRPGPWGWGLFYPLLFLAFLWAFHHTWQRLGGGHARSGSQPGLAPDSGSAAGGEESP